MADGEWRMAKGYDQELRSFTAKDAKDAKEGQHFSFLCGFAAKLWESAFIGVHRRLEWAFLCALCGLAVRLFFP